MSMLYTFNCDICGNKISTRDQECEHQEILEEAGWISAPGCNAHVCRECRPKSKQECDSKCGTTVEINTTGKFTKEEQLHDEGWIQDGGKWFCCNYCHRDHLFGV